MASASGDTRPSVYVLDDRSCDRVPQPLYRGALNARRSNPLSGRTSLAAFIASSMMNTNGAKSVATISTYGAVRSD